METVPQRILERIRALFVLGTSDNPNEAANAVAAAQRLMDEYRLSREDIPSTAEEPIEELGTSIYIGRRRNYLKSGLLKGLADLNGCVAFTQLERSTGSVSLHLVGRRTDMLVTRYMFDYLMREILRLSKLNVEGRGHTRTYVNAYRVGCAQGALDRLEKERKETAAGTQGALVVRTQLEKVRDWVQTHQNLGKGPSMKAPEDAHATRAGYRDGQTIQVSQGLHSGDTPAMLGAGDPGK